MNKHRNEAVEGDDGGLVICRGCKAQAPIRSRPPVNVQRLTSRTAFCSQNPWRANEPCNFA